MKRKTIYSTFFVAGTLLALLISGCAAGNPDDSQLPWARPAPYEGGVPGFGPGTGGY